MKPCNNTYSTLPAAVAEASDAHDSNTASEARRNRNLRHRSGVGKSINGSRRFKLSPALFAIVFGILSALLLPSTARSQTVEELEQQVSQLQSQKDGLQAANATYEQQKAPLVDLIAALDAEIAPLEGKLNALANEKADLLISQFPERNDLQSLIDQSLLDEQSVNQQLNNLDPNSETYAEDRAGLLAQIDGILASRGNWTARLNQLDIDLILIDAKGVDEREELDTLRREKAALQQQIDAIESNIDSNNDSIQEIDTQIGSLQDQINALNNM